MKIGDIILQKRMPGGECLVVQIFESRESYQPKSKKQCFWTDSDWPVLRVLHPAEGLIDDPSYYYDDIGKMYEGR
jgi:hypothetical protein